VQAVLPLGYILGATTSQKGKKTHKKALFVNPVTFFVTDSISFIGLIWVK
jgi:hypothetical protein